MPDPSQRPLAGQSRSGSLGCAVGRTDELAADVDPRSSTGCAARSARGRWPRRPPAPPGRCAARAGTASTSPGRGTSTCSPAAPRTPGTPPRWSPPAPTSWPPATTTWSSAALADGARAHGGGGASAAYPLVVDAGAGTGRLPRARCWRRCRTPSGLALDVSKPALRRAARAHPRAAAALADTWQRLPLADALGGRAAERLRAAQRRRVPPGAATRTARCWWSRPAADHLAELVDALGLLRVDPAKADRVADSLGGHFSPVDSTVHRARWRLTAAEVATLVGMGPSAWHTDPDAARRPDRPRCPSRSRPSTRRPVPARTRHRPR